MLLQLAYGVRLNVQSVAAIQSISGCISVPLYCVRINYTSSGASARESESASVAKKMVHLLSPETLSHLPFHFLPPPPTLLNGSAPQMPQLLFFGSDHLTQSSVRALLVLTPPTNLTTTHLRAEKYGEVREIRR